ncbi:cupin [Novosphingobium sp. AAP83]|uniref:cupin domain-containing protein n=1 Tax=Novosphingobium sp. AAP83 TaxID=1523425 RepID=UPI0006B88B43|nr:cupin domain-containing protein [Novosphingobium sp. AAP83]KPF89749.1 cupin [Novosphingobium sp. AAP83]
MTQPFRRIVTGHDSGGAAIIVSDGKPERVESLGPHGPTFYEVWNTRETPAAIDRMGCEPKEAGLILAPPTNGTRIRVLDIEPDAEDIFGMSDEEAKAHFEKIGAGDASARGRGDAPHPFMHRTETIDYGIVLDGEITLIVDKGETVVRTGDIVVQKGTNHAWANRSGRVCRMAFILIDGKFTDGISI